MGLHSLDNWLLLLVFSMQLETYGLSCAVIEKVRRKRMTVVKKGFTCGWCNICLDVYLKSLLDVSEIVFLVFYLGIL